MFVPDSFPTTPGILMNVTPDKLAPIIPIATNTQLELLSAVKNVALLLFLDVKYDIRTRTAKYAVMTSKTISEDIFCIGVYLLKLQYTSISH